MSRNTHVPLCFVLALWLSGCTTSQTVNEVSPIDSTIFRGEWFDYYNRALRYIAAENSEEAWRDLEQAIRRLPSDSHRARAYGVHFQTYYPHRELGILALAANDLDRAERELEQSFLEAPTSKGIYYLNEVRRLRIRAEDLDKTPPRISLDAPAEFTNRRTLTIAGRVLDDTYVDRIWVNEQEQYFELAEPEVGFSSTIRLKPGVNKIKIAASDLAGRTAEDEFEIVLDLEGPILGLRAVRVTGDEASRKAHVSCTALDKSSITLCRIGNVELEAGKETLVIDRQFDVPAGDDSLPFLLRDQCGNVNRGRIELKDPAGRWRVGSISRERRIYLACADSILASHLISAVSSISAPRIEFGVPGDQRYVYREEFFVDGKIYAPDGVASVQLNGEDLQVAPGYETHFSHLAELKAGTNEFCVAAEDQAGRSTLKTLELIREIADAFRHEERLCVVWYGFQEPGEVPTAVVRGLTNLVNKDIYRGGRFRVLDREMLDEVLLEQIIGAHSLNQKAPVRLDEMQTADMLLYGKTTPANPGFEIDVYVMNVHEQTSPVPPLNVFLPEDAERGLDYYARGLYLKLEDEFPLVKGTLLNIRRNTASVTLSEKHRMFPGRHLYVYREGEHLIEEGYDFGPEIIDLGELEVVRIQGRISKAEILSLVKGEQLQRGDFVISD